MEPKPRAESREVLGGVGDDKQLSFSNAGNTLNPVPFSLSRGPLSFMERGSGFSFP